MTPQLFGLSFPSLIMWGLSSIYEIAFISKRPTAPAVDEERSSLELTERRDSLIEDAYLTRIGRNNKGYEQSSISCLQFLM